MDDDDGGDGDGDGDGGDGDDDGDIYIMMKCVFVCLSRKIITSSFKESLVTTVIPVREGFK